MGERKDGREIEAMVWKIKAMGSDGKKESIGMVEGLIEAVLSLIEPSP